MMPICPLVAATRKNAAVFLLPPYETATERADALLGCSELVRQAIEHAVRAGHDALGFELLEMAQRIEAAQA